MFDQLTALGYGIVTFAIIIGVGVMVVLKFGQSVLDACTDGTAINTSNLDYCYNTTDIYNNQSEIARTDSSGGDALMVTMEGYMGSGGLAGWTPAVIALAVGMLFLGAFLIGRGGRSY